MRHGDEEWAYIPKGKKLENWLCSLGLEGDASDLAYSDGQPLDMSRLLRNVRTYCELESRTVPSMRPLSGEKQENSMDQSGMASLTSCPLVSHASHLAKQVKGKAKTTNETCGPIQGASFVRSSQCGSGWKTCQDSEHPTCTKSSPTLPISGTMRNGTVYRRHKSERHTSANEFGFWDKEEETPTPTTNDPRNATLPPSQKEWDNIPGFLLRNGVESGMELNPAWVEYLMGWPVGWGDLDDGPDMDNWGTWPHAPLDHPELEPVKEDKIRDKNRRTRATGNGQVPLQMVFAVFVLSERIQETVE